MDKAKFSRHRKKLTELAGEIPVLIREFFPDTPVIRGSVYQTERKCGKKNCVCARGKPHKRNVLSDKQDGKTILKTIPEGQFIEVKIKATRYRKVREARAKLGLILRQMLEIVDEMERMRREEM